MKEIVRHIQKDWIKYGLETLAILIGILGAQFLSNLNEQRNERELEQEYLINLLADLENQVVTTESQMSYEIGNQEICKNLLEFIHEPPYLVDSINIEFMKLARKTFVVSKVVFEDLKYSGHLASISDQNFRYELAKFYQKTAYTEMVKIKNNESHADKLLQDIVHMGLADYGTKQNFILMEEYDFSLNVTPFTGSQQMIEQMLYDDQIRFRIHNMLSFRGKVNSVQHRILTELLEENRRMIALLTELLKGQVLT